MDQIEFQLKLHTLQRTILIKQDQLHVVEAKLDKIGSIRIESENQIIQLISDVHQTMKSLERIIVQIKDPCYQLRMNSLYDMFRNICYTMINAVKLLGQGCQNGVQRNLFRYYASSQNTLLKGETICVEQKNDENNQIQTSIKQKQETYCDAIAQLQISKLYVSIQAEKQSVMKTFPSNVVTKLNEVRASWLKIVDDSDKILEEAYYRKNEDARSNFKEKLHKAEYITKVLKQELSQSLKKYFKDTVERTIKKMYSLFYLNEYQKLKSEYEKKRVTNIQAEAQTDVEGINKIKQWQRERKNYEKAAKQLQNVKTEKNRINQQYLIAAGNNQLYIKRIQELERKLLTFIPINLRSIDKRVSQDRKMTQSKRDSIKQAEPSPENAKQNIQKVEMNPKFNMIYSNQNNQTNQLNQSVNGEIRSQNSQKSLNEKENQIILKKNKMKRVYTKSKLRTDYLEKEHKIQKKTSIVQSSLISSSTGIKNERDYIKSKELVQSQNLQQNQLVNSEQLKLAVTKILQFTHQIRKGDEQDQQKKKQQPNQMNNIVKEQQKNKQNEVSVSAHHQILADKIISNSSMKGVLSLLLRKALSMNKSKKELKKQASERLSVNKKNQVTSQSSLKAKQNNSLINIVVQESNNINYKKYKKSRNSIEKLNIFAKKIRHSKEQSSFFHLKPKDFPQEIEKDGKSIQIDKNEPRLSGQLNKNGHKTLGQQLMRQVLANRIKTQETEICGTKHKQKSPNQKNRTSKAKMFEKHLQNSMFQNLNISQFSNNVFKMKVKQTFKNTLSSENFPKAQQDRPSTENMREIQNNKMIAIKSVKSNEIKQIARCQNNKITKDIIEIVRNVERRKSNTELEKVLSNYIQTHLINGSRTSQRRKSSSKLFKNRLETE